jgi:hypothetical protein
MLTSAAYFHDTRFLCVLAILATVLAVFLCGTVTCRVSTFLFLVLCHINTCLLMSIGLYARTGVVAGQVAPTKGTSTDYTESDKTIS